MSDQQRVASDEARVVRWGCEHPQVAVQHVARLESICPLPGSGWDVFAQAADPDLAVSRLAQLMDTAFGGAIAEELRFDPQVRSRLVAVLGVSEALADHLIRHPYQWTVIAHAELTRPDELDLRAELLRAGGANPESAEPCAALPEEAALLALRIAYRGSLLGTATRDVALGASLDDVAGELADLADAALAAGLAIARSGLAPDAEPCRFAVIGMGKCGGRELNYVSDVDVIFVAEPLPGGDESGAIKTATRLATGLMRACNAATVEGSLWEVDPALRPEGKQGVLVRTLGSHIDYYERWAKTWEFQALLKARVSAGDMDLGNSYLEAISPMVWRAAQREGFVSDVQAMRRRVESNIPAQHAERQLKLGPGGLRDVEFSVQLLQLVHGRSDVMLRSPTTLIALEALATWGYVGLEDASTLGAAYRFLRTLEHRIQIYQLKRTHVVPETESDLRRIGRSMGFRFDPVVDLTEEWRRHSREVRRIHEKLFYRPLLNAVARLGPGEARLTPAAARDRLEALGYVDAVGALQQLEALTSGVSRRAAIQRTLLPVLLGWFADAPDPDSGLLAFRRVSDALGSAPWYLRLLRDESSTAERMAKLLSSSKFATNLLLSAPEAVSLLADESELQPRSAWQVRTECEAAAGRAENLHGAAVAVRGVRRREMFRVAAGAVLELTDGEAVGRGLSDIADAAIAATLNAAIRAVEEDLGHELPTRIAIIGMGRLGGAELSFGSDADVMFVHDPQPGIGDKEATDIAMQVVGELRRVLTEPSTEPALDFDADLRPEGKNGPLVRSIASYTAYYERWSAPWESQALVRARVVGGDSALGADFITMVDSLRWPNGGLTSDALREIRRLKARMEAERLPRGADPTLHTKLGRGGLSDVEWSVQLLQMQHAHKIAGLRTTNTLEALRACVSGGVLAESDAAALSSAWTFATRVRDAITLAQGKSNDVVPTAGRELGGVAHLLGYLPSERGALVEDYRRVTRRARSVMDRVFYGV